VVLTLVYRASCPGKKEGDNPPDFTVHELVSGLNWIEGGHSDVRNRVFLLVGLFEKFQGDLAELGRVERRAHAGVEYMRDIWERRVHGDLERLVSDKVGKGRLALWKFFEDAPRPTLLHKAWELWELGIGIPIRPRWKTEGRMGFEAKQFSRSMLSTTSCAFSSLTSAGSSELIIAARPCHPQVG
jgi:hypothetical protein